jgi:hypothetical protein
MFKHSRVADIRNISSDCATEHTVKQINIPLERRINISDKDSNRGQNSDSDSNRDEDDNSDSNGELIEEFQYPALGRSPAHNKYINEDDDALCDFDDLLLNDSEAISLEHLADNVPHIPMTTTLIVAATKINHEVAEIDISSILLANEHIPIIECNYAISICVDCAHPVITKVAELLLYPTKQKQSKKQSTSKLQIVTTTDKLGRILSSENRIKDTIKQYMNSCIQYNVIGLNGMIYRVKRFTTGNIQVPNTIDEHTFEDAKYAVDRVIEYESKLFERTITYAPDYLASHNGKYFHINLLNYKFEVIKGWIINITKVNRHIKELKAAMLAATKGLIPTDLPHIEDTPLTYKNLYISDINDDMKNAVLYVGFNIPTVKLVKQNTKPSKNNKPRKIKRKDITVSISPNGKCNIQGGMENRQPAQLIYEFLLNMFKTRPEFYIKQLLTDDQIRARAIEKINHNNTIYQMCRQRLYNEDTEILAADNETRFAIIARDIFYGFDEYEVADVDDNE